MEQAVIDRFEADYAVLLVGEARQPLNVPRNLLPEKAGEGSWLRIERVDEQVVRAEFDEEATETAQQRIADKLARLRRGEHLQ